MGKLTEFVKDLHVTGKLRLMKNQTLQVQGSTGSFTDVANADVAALAGLAAELALIDGLTATAAELNQAADTTGRYEVVTATNVITAAEDRKTFFLDAAAGFTSTLPAPALGLKFKFVVRTAPTSNGYIIATNGGADIIKGGISEGDPTAAAASPSDDNADALTLVANVALAGDWVEVESDGTYWYMRGHTRADGGLTTATT